MTAAAVSQGTLVADQASAVADPYLLSPVAILAPAGRDGAMAKVVLSRAGLVPHVCATMGQLCESIGRECGAVLVAEEALVGAARGELIDALGSQPSWSDVPVVVLTGEDELSRALSPALIAVTTRANATLLERPVRVATLVTALKSALRARRRQFDVRDHLAERTAAEAALRAAREQADDANRAKSEFLAVMSHELRTPLNAIGGYTELLEIGVHGPVNETQAAALERIQRSQRHLLGLINGVLNYAKLDAGHVHYELTDVALDEVISTCEAFIAPQAQSRDIRVRHVGDPQGLHVRGDEEKVQQVILNLLTNALKFTAAGGTVSIACEAAPDGSTVATRISDTGRGIAPEQLERIFQPFVQVDARFARSQEGVGLGLAISRDLARGMNGDLMVESTLDAGSTFTLLLPRA